MRIRAILCLVLWVSVRLAHAAGDAPAALWPAAGVALSAGETPSSSPLSAPDGNGGAIVVWWEADGLRAQRVNAEGTRLWAEGGVRVEQTDLPGHGSERSLGEAAVVADGLGGVIVAFTRAVEVAAGWLQSDLYAQRIAGDGTLRWSPFGLPIASACWDVDCVNEKQHPRVAVDDEGNAFFTWDETRDGFHFASWAQKVDRDGAILWAESGVPVDAPFHPSYPYGFSFYPDVVPDGAGGAYVATTDFFDDHYPALQVQRLGADDGARLWSGRGLRVTAELAGGTDSYALLADGAGGLFVVWGESRSPAPTVSEIYAQRIDGEGNLLWDPLGTVIAGGPGWQQAPEIVADGAGGFVVAWLTRPVTAGSASYAAQRLDGDGHRLWAPDGVPLFAASGAFDFSTRPVIVSDDAHGAIVGAGIGRPIVTATGDPTLVVQRVDASGTARWGANGFEVHARPATDESLKPSLARDGAGGAIAAWWDARTGVGESYAQRVSDGSAVPAPPLEIHADGSGSGRVVSEGGALDCRGSCVVPPGTGTVVLHAIADEGWEFVGWSGACAGLDTCSVTSDEIGLVTASFEARPRLRVVSVGGSGRISGNGIDCGSTCEATFAVGTDVALAATASPGSQLVEWAGDCIGLADCAVEMVRDRFVVAVFRASPKLDVTIGWIGSGTITSDDGRIDCGTRCQAIYDVPRLVTLTAVAAPGSRFAGWTYPCDETGATATCTIPLDDDRSISARFDTAPMSLGLFRPGNQSWYLDRNASGGFDGCDVDECPPPFGYATDVPVSGDWTGRAATSIGVYRPSDGRWYLDANFNHRWDGCRVDFCTGQFGLPGDVPVVGDWGGTNVSSIGVFRPSNQTFYLDRNGNRRWDGCAIDVCSARFGLASDVPVAGDWNDVGQASIGTYRPSTGTWYLDANRNYRWDGCSIDRCVTFGIPGDVPVAADWSGQSWTAWETTTVGVYRPSTGRWYADFNGNGRWDGCAVDRCWGPFGAPADRPIVGFW